MICAVLRKPGEMLCILGDNQSGASELLKVLARRLSSANVMGEVLIDGLRLNHSNFKDKVKYVPKVDRHIAHLSVQGKSDKTKKRNSRIYSQDHVVVRIVHCNAQINHFIACFFEELLFEKIYF